jgi:hypothetical protein
MTPRIAPILDLTQPQARLHMTDAQLALIVSGASAMVAVASFVWTIGWSVWQHRRLHHPRVTVLAADALPVWPGGSGEWCVSVTIVNDGAVAVTITSVKFVVRDDTKRRGLFPTQWVRTDPQPLPIKLTPGDKWTGLADHASIASTLRDNFGHRSEFKLWVVVTDAADRSYRAKFAMK